MSKSRDLADSFIAFIRNRGLAEGFVRDHAPIEGRRFRIDLAHLPSKLAVEIHGGTWAQGRHSRHAGMASDLEKERLLTLAGWRCIAFTGEEVKRRPIATLETIMEHVNAPRHV